MLRCFVAVAQTESFTKAGENIGLTQSGVSVKIKRLEDKLGSSVFNRTRKNLSLTLEGEVLMKYARRILADHDEAVLRLCEPKVSGNLRVGLAEYFIPELLPTLLSKFRKYYPAIHLEVQTGFGMNLIPLYERGELDLVVAGAGPNSSPNRIIAQEPLVWVSGRDIELPERDPVPLALLPAPCGFRKVAIDMLEKSGRDWEVLFTGTSVHSIQAAVQAGMGFSVLPLGALGSEVRQAPLSYGFPTLPIHTLSLFTDDDNTVPAKELFIEYLEYEIRKKQHNYSNY